MNANQLPLSFSAPAFENRDATSRLTRARYAEAFEFATRVVPLLARPVRDIAALAIESARQFVGSEKWRWKEDEGRELFGGACARPPRELLEAFRRHCYLMEGTADGAVYKTRTQPRQWAAGVYIEGLGSFVAHWYEDRQWGEAESRGSVMYQLTRDDFFLPSYEDGMRYVRLSESVWHPSYCADKIAFAKDVASVKPFKFRGRLWVNVGGSGNVDYREGECWSLRPIEQWPERRHTYQSKLRATESGSVERGSYRGLVVSVRGKQYVLDTPLLCYDDTVRDAGSDQEEESETPADDEPEPAKQRPVIPMPVRMTKKFDAFDVDGNALAVGSKCKIVSVHHPVFNDNIGKPVVVGKIYETCVAIYDDRPIRYRVNRAGRSVIASDPSNHQTLISANQLQLSA
ncbi:hypothetical protein [Burkholderia stagnalis]|nr:hypothetical protein [Burkholderia stagnalis]